MSTKIKEAIHITARYYGRKIDDDVLLMMAEDLADLCEDEVIAAYHSYRRNPKNRVMPLPAQIREIVQPEIDVDSLAKEIASRIAGAIPKYGWSNAAAARAFIGDDGWRVVERFGGWVYLCENYGLSVDAGTFYAQTRDLLRVRLTHSDEKLTETVRLNGGPPARVLELISQVKKIE